MNICEFLGLKPYREFKVEGEIYKYRFSEDDRLEYYNSSFREWRFCSNIEVLSKILHDDSLIEVVDDDEIYIGMSFHDVVVINGLNKMNGSKIVRIERNVKYKNEHDEHWNEEINFFFENDERLVLSWCNVKLDFLEKFDNEVFEVEYLDGGYIRVWGC